MPAWRTSTYCETGACVQVATALPPSFRMSSKCAGGECAEVAACTCGDGVLVRDKALGGSSPVLEFTPQAWRKFTAALKA